MPELPSAGPPVVLVHLQFPDSDGPADRQEFIELARSTGAGIRAMIGGRRQRPDASLFIGSGKADEVGNAVRAERAKLVMFNHELSPSQERNLEERLQCRVLGRTGLILDIFARRARTHEGKLQVELAQLQHLSTRLVRGWLHLERQRGGIGLRGPGETQLEVDRRLIRKRIATLQKRLERVRRRRAQNRRARVRSERATISLVGYTNAGKSTLFNALTGAHVPASSKLFATLDPTLRRLALPGSRSAVIADTVGFIRNLPHDLVAAFRATLEESREADLLLHVVDAADPERTARIEQVHAVLAGIDALQIPRLEVFNKIDLRAGEQPRLERDATGLPARVWGSAQTGLGLDVLRNAIAECMGPPSEEYELQLPPAAGRLRARLFAQGAVCRESIEASGIARVRVRMPHRQLRQLLHEAGLTESATVATLEPPP
ncbi:MAG: GTPase HflX [Nevskiales bacterium]|nr:GTPase HflX [Nevskiales bacterium]